ncbi:hypothetical protein bplSymb_SCF02501P001 [Bathymodiolus platifrons methanotrophic gill symbiont]|nr:hypothetical protein bplSymb_SCF02501P001 [Bathymodiolus platifrons methanotrophic gill symbiont]
MQERVSALYKASLQDKMSALFDEYSCDEEVIRLEKVEINLGVFNSMSALEAQLENKIIEQLELALVEQFTEARSSNAKPFGLATENNTSGQETSKASIHTTLESRLDLLCYYLKTGELPWWGADSNWQLEQEILQLLKKRRGQTAQALRRSASTALYERLAMQLSSTTRLNLLDALKPNQKTLLRDFQQQWFGMIKHILNCVVTSAPLNIQVELKHLKSVLKDQEANQLAFWLLIFKQFIENETIFTADIYAGMTTRHLAEITEIDYATVIVIFISVSIESNNS